MVFARGIASVVFEEKMFPDGLFTPMHVPQNVLNVMTKPIMILFQCKVWIDVLFFRKGGKHIVALSRYLNGLEELFLAWHRCPFFASEIF